jgi:putative PIN family toxin of toxin-antitoxin system
MKVIIDCNVLIAAGIKDGVCRSVLKYVVQNCELYISRDIILEYLLVSRRSKFQEYQHYLEKVIELISRVAIVEEPHSADINLPDIDDKKYLDLAFHIKADFLITGNLKHFPELKYGNTLIIDPHDFAKDVVNREN